MTKRIVESPEGFVDSATAGALGETLRAAGFTASGIRERVGPEIYAAYRQGKKIPLESVVGGSAPLDVLIRLFVLFHELEESEVAPLLPLESIRDMVAVEDGKARCLVHLEPWESPAGDAYALSDRALPGVLPDDHVMGVTGSSMSVANLVVRAPTGRALDLGTGSGLQSVLLSRHAEHLTMVDVNPRALRFARTTLDLNGITVPAEIELSDLYSDLDDREFDLIVSNPPYVVGPHGTQLFRDAAGRGDDISRRVIQEGARRLRPGGLLHTNAQWLHIRGQSWEDRVRGWLEGLGCDAWAAQFDVLNVVDHTLLWMVSSGAGGQVGTFRHWQEALADAVAVGTGVVTLRRTTGTPVIRVEHQPSGARLALETASWLAGVDLLRSPRRRFDAAAVRLRPSAYVRQKVTPQPPQAATLANDEGLFLRVEVPQKLIDVLARCDGRTATGKIIASADEDETVVRETIRKALSAGMLLSGASALGRPTTILKRAIFGLTIAVEVPDDSAEQMSRLLPGRPAAPDAKPDRTWRIFPTLSRIGPYAYPPDHPTYSVSDLELFADNIHDWVAENAGDREAGID